VHPESPEFHDIETRDDIARLVETFYTRAFADPVLGPIFVDIVQLDLEAHMPIMCDFWENILFGARKYPGGMMMVHFQVHQRVSLEPHHFQRWLDYWESTVDDLFHGDRANVAKVHAGRVAVSMGNRFQQVPGGPRLAPPPFAP
jgi:hemoglobin